MKRAKGDGRPRTGPYEAAVRFLAARPRSIAEIRRHLRAKRHADAGIDLAIEKLRGQGYLDDLEFARYWIERRSRFRPKGGRLLAAELRTKGVPKDAIDAAMDELTADPEVDRARRAIARSLSRWESLETGERSRKISSFLASRGFDVEVIDEVVASPRAAPSSDA